MIPNYFTTPSTCPTCLHLINFYSFLASTYIHQYSSILQAATALCFGQPPTFFLFQCLFTLAAFCTNCFGQLKFQTSTTNKICSYKKKKLQLVYSSMGVAGHGQNAVHVSVTPDTGFLADAYSRSCLDAIFITKQFTQNPKYHQSTTCIKY